MAASTKTAEEKATEKEASYANGFRKVREDKGYSRVAAADALGITPGALWKIEHQAEGKELAAAIKELKALPQAPKVERAKKEKPAAAEKATTAKKAPAKKATAKPAAATDLI